MNNTKNKHKINIYIAILTIAAVLLSIYIFRLMDWHGFNYFAFLLFLFLTFLADSFPVTIPKGGVVSVSFAPIFATILLFEPGIVILTAVLGDLFSLRKGRIPVAFIFNASQLTICAGGSALVYHMLNPEGLGLAFSTANYVAIFATLVTFFVLNSALVTIILSLIQSKKPYPLWLTNIKWSAPSFLSMAPIGILITLIYLHVGFWGLVLFLVPLILARHSFQSHVSMRQTFLDTIKSLSVAIDAKDPYTRGHSSRVANYAVSLARELRWAEDKIELLQYVALIHDVGKIAMPESILKKEGSLTKQEYDSMKTHSEVGAEIIKDINYFADGSANIRHHHEQWNGGGYPDGIEGEAIPIGARILAVADAFDAMTSDRPYRKALSPLTALQELRECSGSQFDPKVVEAFEKLYPKLEFEEDYSDTDKRLLYSEEAAAEIASK